MTLNQLLYFQTVARLENYHRAADELYISQPSLSRAIAALEEEFGIELFEKKGRRIQLTKAGKMFLGYANRILGECEIAKKKMLAMSGEGGRIDIGLVSPLADQYMPHMVRKFLNKEENDKVTFNFYQNHTPGIVKKVKSGELDVGFGGYMGNEDKLEFLPLLVQDMVVITPKGHELDGHNKISIEELTKYPVIGYDRESWMGQHLQDLYQRLGLRPNIVMDCPDERSIAALVSENFGIGLISVMDSLDRERVSVHELNDIDLKHRVFMFWRKDRYQMPATSRFIEYMKQHQEFAD